MFIAASPFCMLIDVVVAMIRAGAPVDAVLAEFIGLGLGVTFFWNMLCVKIMWTLCSRWACHSSTWVWDCLVSLVIFLVFLLLLAVSNIIVTSLLTISTTGAMAAGIGLSVSAILVYSNVHDGCLGRPCLKFPCSAGCFTRHPGGSRK